MIVETYTDAFNSIAGTIIFTPAEKKAAEMEAWRDGILTKLLTIVEKHLSMNPIDKFLCGDELTIADFVLASLTFNILKNELNPVHALCKSKLIQFPQFGAYTHRLRTQLANYLDNRPKYPL